jgi:4-aminobutyrate aminotransferase
VVHTPYPNCYRCPFGQTPESCAVECVRHIEETLLHTIAPANETAAIVVEPVQGEGGYVVPPRKFFDELSRVARQNGILLICDEVQSGMGRTGRMWASAHFDLVPDIMTVAKGIASGLPLGATVARADLMTWPPGAHASTFGGNPVACAAALMTIQLLEESLLENAARMGEYLKQRMAGWTRAFPRGRRRPRTGPHARRRAGARPRTKEKAPALRDRVVDLAFERGLLILGAGDTTLRLCPPLIISRDQCDFAIDTLEECLTLAAATA